MCMFNEPTGWFLPSGRCGNSARASISSRRWEELGAPERRGAWLPACLGDFHGAELGCCLRAWGGGAPRLPCARG